MTDGGKDYRPLSKVSTFEINGVIKTVCIDRLGDSVTHIYRNTNPFENPKNKTFLEFIKSCGCRVVHHYHNGVYKYTCKYYGRLENNVELIKEY